jgi:hypothetical protein
VPSRLPTTSSGCAHVRRRCGAPPALGCTNRTTKQRQRREASPVYLAAAQVDGRVDEPAPAGRAVRAPQHLPDGTRHVPLVGERLRRLAPSSKVQDSRVRAPDRSGAHALASAPAR